MPYAIKRSKDKFLVVNSDTGDIKGTHDREADAKKQLAALYVHANDTKKVMSNHTTFLTIEKRDDAQHLVEGYASSEDIDLQGGTWEGQAYEGDIVQAAAIEKALPEYMEWANVREMHNENAVGTILKAEVIRGTVELPGGRKLLNPLHVIAKIVDPGAWEKVITGVYKGFSIQADVFKLKLTKIADRVVRLIQSIRLTEISLVDRPANPGAKIILWKGANMAKKVVSVAKAADPQKVISMLQELRDAAEMEGDLEKAGQLSDGIALVLQSQGAAEEIVAEPAEEAEEEHEDLGKPSPTEEEKPATEEEKQAAMDGLDHEQVEKEEEKPAAEDEKKDEEKKEVEETKKVLQPSAETIQKTEKKKAPAKPVDVVSKAEILSITKRLDDMGNAFSNDIARIAKAFEDLSETVESLKARPVIKEIPFQGLGPNVDGQTVEIMKALQAQAEDPTTKDFLQHKITEAEIKATKPNYVGFTR